MIPSNASAQSHLLVAVQLTGIVLVIYGPDDTSRGSQWMLLVGCIGFLIAMWTLFHNEIGNFGIYPEPKDNSKLVTTGPYEIVRHPMYFGLIVMMFGMAGYNNAWSNYVGFVMVGVAVFLKAHKEEILLLQTFEDYAEYQKSVKMLKLNLLKEGSAKKTD